MHDNLYRSLDYEDLRWHSIGPEDHCRCAFNMIDLVGFASVKCRTRDVMDVLRDWRGGAPYYLYRPYRWCGEPLPKDIHYASEQEAKEAGRRIILEWLAGAGSGPVIWEAVNTGTHFWAHADGPEIATMYCNPAEKDHSHKGIRVWFGKTFYTLPFDADHPEEAKAVVEQTWRQWLEIAKARFLAL